MKPSHVLAAASLILGTLVIARPADVAKVRVEVNGVVYAGELQPQTAPTTSPATLPVSETFTGQAPFAVHLEAGIDPTRVRDIRVTWNFGDPTAAFDVLDGYNAAHVYDTPGTYSLTRTINDSGVQSIVRYAVEVKPPGRRNVFVSADGDDRFNGSTEALAVKSWNRAIAMVNANTSLRFRRGDTFAVDKPLMLSFDDVQIGAFGDPAKPQPMLTTTPAKGVASIFNAGGKAVLIEDLAFDAAGAKPFEKAGTADVIVASGTGLVVRNCAFHNVNYGVNGNGRPTNVLFQSNVAPLESGLRAYLVWIQGANWTVLGNSAANSTREHIIRVGGGDRVNIQYNDFTNLDRRGATTNPDNNDTAKAALNIQKGTSLYVAHNLLTGPNGVGPLGGNDGLNEKGSRWIGAVIEENRIDGFYEVNHGAEHVTLRNNVVRLDNGAAFKVIGFDANYGRGTIDVMLDRNTAINSGTQGNFVIVGGGAKNVSLFGNLYVAPNLVPGAYQSAAVYVYGDDLRAFAAIRGNVWPVAKPNNFAQNGVNYVAAEWGRSEGYRDAAEWNGLSPVSGDRTENISLDAINRPANLGAATVSAGADQRLLPTPRERSK